MICPHCHTENRPGAKFCNECGQKLDQAQEREEAAAEEAAAGVAAEVEVAEPFASEAEACDFADAVAEPIAAGADAPAEAEEAAEAAEVSEANGEADEVIEPAAEVAIETAAEAADEVADVAVSEAADEAPEVPESVEATDEACEVAETADEEAAVDELPEPLARTGVLPRINIVAAAEPAPVPAPSAAPSVEVGKTQVINPVASPAPDGASTDGAGGKASREVAESAASGKADKPAEKADAPAEKLAEEPATPKADLSGFDEYLVGPGYMPAPSAWRAGDTMQMPALKDVETPKQKEFKAPADPHKPSRKGKGKGGKIAAIVIAVLVVAAAIAAGVTYQMELWGGKVVPDVTGMTQADAAYVLQGKGFTVRTTSVASDETEGIVLLMDPVANARQQEGSEVVIHVSTSRLVPDVVGKSQDEAAQLLSDNGFENVTYVQERSDEAAGTVLSISPDAGEKAKAKSAITVAVAQPYTVPDVTGMTPTAAAAAIEEAGLTSRTVTVYNESIPEGYMIGIDPASGSEVTSDTVVTISVAKSRGTELVAAARNYLAGGSLKASDGSTFTISSVNSCTYQGNDEVAFTATGVASTSVTVLGQTLSVSGDSKQVSGTIGFDAYNNVVSISFS